MVLLIIIPFYISTQTLTFNLKKNHLAQALLSIPLLPKFYRPGWAISAALEGHLSHKLSCAPPLPPPRCGFRQIPSWVSVSLSATRVELDEKPTPSSGCPHPVASFAYLSVAAGRCPCVSPRHVGQKLVGVSSHCSESSDVPRTVDGYVD